MSDALQGPPEERPEPIIWRFIALRPPPFLNALLVTLLAFSIAIGLRVAVVGFPEGLGASSTFFPAFIVVTLYAGARWGWSALVLTSLFAWFSPWQPSSSLNQQAIVGLFAVSGVVTVAVATALREALVRLRREAAARGEAEAMLRLAEKAGGLGLWHWNLASGDATWSQGAFENLGIPTTARAAQETLLAVVHPDDREALVDTNRRALSGAAVQTDFRVVDAEGRERWIHARGQVHGEGGDRRLVGYNLDVTERYRGAEKLRESEERFRSLADSAPALMWLSRLGGEREFVNAAYIAFVGDGETDARTLDWRQRLHPDDLPRVLREQLAGESSMKPFSLEARYRRGDGEWRWLKSFSQPRLEPSGEFSGFGGIAFDVTDAKQVEADLQRINDLLAERVEAALAERDEAQAALSQSQKLEALGQLTGGVAHDFNNLLTVIIGAMDMVQRHPDDPERVTRLGKAALDAAHRGERLTRQLLAFSRRQPLRPEALVADELILESEPLLRGALGERHQLDLRLDAADSPVRLDRGQFDAAVMNLLANARDAMATGGPVSLTTAAIELADEGEDALPPGRYLSLQVSDTGEGMDAATLARVFEPFFSTKPVGKGTGLGLSQVYGFVRQSGGAVRIVSAPGEGATITLLLPIAERPAAAAPVAVGAPRSAEALTVLLVEDDLQVAALAEAMLFELGHTVELARNPAEALAVVKRDPRINLVLTDVIMPGPMTGVDLAYAAVKARPGLPVVLSSGYTGEALGAAEDAPWPLLRKPYTLEALTRALDAAAEGTASQYVNG